jgi:hypothetical protein
MILILSSDTSHHPLKTWSVPLLVILVNKIGVDHFMGQGSLNLLNIKVFIPKKLNRKINLGYRKLLAVSHESQHSASFVSTVSCGGGHSIIPYNRNIWDFIIEMLVVQSNKHRLNIWVSKMHFISPVDYV